MELAKVTTSGQITIPVQIRRKLGIKEGDKVMFLEEGNRVILLNSSQIALEKLQSAMSGEAEKAGIRDEEDVAELCKDVRKELYSERYARNDRHEYPRIRGVVSEWFSLGHTEGDHVAS